jgi:hypothetical protein
MLGEGDVIEFVIRETAKTSALRGIESRAGVMEQVFSFMEEVFPQLSHTLVTNVTLKVIIAVTHMAKSHLLHSSWLNQL